MLVAYGPDNQPIIAEDALLGQLQGWSRARALRCPNCRGIVHVRGGPDRRTQIHFAHQQGECEWSTEAESVRHARGKMVLAQWLRQQYPQATITLEERLPTPNRIADIFVKHASGKLWAVEFQCAPLDVAEWQKRHEAYRQAGIIDTWIIGDNRREKQEGFIEAVLTVTREVLFLDPLATPPRAWLRWPISRQQALAWQSEQQHSSHLSQNAHTPVLDGWVGRMGFGMTITASLHEFHLDERARLFHPTRTASVARARLLQAMNAASVPDETQLRAYLRQHPACDEKALQLVLIPLLKSYRRDPDLLRRYNYGRGTGDQPLNDGDRLRVEKARNWLHGLIRQGFSPDALRELFQALPLAGPYAAFAGYAETLLTLVTHGQL